ncbi:quaternary ammonium transporter [Paucilactobacillus hokkaidonensis JCM 18461]|uniref:Quaternary ammonium transporter n=2 Tax=Paucilactobacillus hokkaidonensis TaxID=1193095 RepID=A0A0A1GSA8_9LACO|nr:multidrug efflux SMR transporter [Paucilactobacillus hokkaidonensis]KRO09383.1 hypothetical protein IV59_GL000722 [Paucilactobacillus hokkaidonensis]BAP84890.1 quaternary ammonium transporter [Paucilactobacillus hokkaidonensis JCM 18461]
MGYLFLGLAIIGEVIGTSLLKASAGFTQLVPTISSLVSYGLCFYFLSLTMKSVNLNVAYAIWAGLGLILTTIIAVFYWKETINIAGLIGIALILCGVVILNLFNAPH